MTTTDLAGANINNGLGDYVSWLGIKLREASYLSSGNTPSDDIVQGIMDKENITQEEYHKQISSRLVKSPRGLDRIFSIFAGSMGSVFEYLGAIIGKSGDIVAYLPSIIVLFVVLLILIKVLDLYK